MKIDAAAVFPNLWQGSKPPQGHHVAEAGFDALVLCAKEIQPSGRAFPGVRVFHAPLDDHPRGLTGAELKTWLAATDAVVALLRRNQRVLVTCHAGLNRSGIVCAETLCRLGLTPDDAIRRVRISRGPLALCNKAFVRLLRARFMAQALAPTPA